MATRPDGSELTKAQVVASYRSGQRGYVGLEMENGREVENRVLYARVWARRGGRGQAVAQFSTPLS